MRKGSELLGLPIISKQDGDKIAEVKEIIYSSKKFRVTGFLINEKGIFKEAEIIKFKDIDKIGKDAIMIKSKKLIEKANQIPEIYDMISNKKKVIGIEVITEDGESMGYVQDIIIDDERGKILGFILTDGLIQDIMDGRNILPYINGIKFGDSVLILSRKIKEEFLKNKKEYKKLLELH